MRIKFLKYCHFSIFFLVLLLFSQFGSAQQVDKKLEFSGFARVVLGYLDETDATYLGYDDSLSLSEQSLIALQADYQVSDKFSVTTQVLGSSDDDRDSGLEWLYLTYEPNRFTQVKLGRQRTPFFNYSDVIDVGFAYPWITLPQQVYSTLFFSTFDGISAGYERSVGNLVLGVEVSWGNFDGDIITGGFPIPSDVNNIQGVIFNAGFDNLNFRAAYHRANVFLDVIEFSDFSSILTELGFDESAASLDTDGKVEFYQLSGAYETIDYFIRAEYTRVQGESSVVPLINSFYVAAGYNYGAYTSYISYSKTSSTTTEPVDEIPLGINSELDFLSANYNLIYSQLDFDTSDSITAGTRWNWTTNLAIKAEVTLTRARSGNSTVGFEPLNEDFDNQAPLYQLALEWVF